MTQSIPNGKRRWWRVAAAVFVLVPLILVAALPWALGTPPARRWLLKRANQALAPGGLDFGTIRFSWFGPTRITNFVLKDPEGDQVIAAPQARWDRNLRQILFDQPRYGTLLLDRAHLDVERRADGTVDLYEALKPVLTGDPELDLNILVHHGVLRFRSAGVPDPVTANYTDFALRLAPNPQPLTWRLFLANEIGTPRARDLEILGQFERWDNVPGGQHDLELNVKGNHWPWTFEREGLSASGTLQGALAFNRRGGSWTLTGDARFGNVAADGPPLAGDHPRFDEIQGVWDLAESSGVWTVRRLDLTAPVGKLRASGTVASATEGTGRIEGTLDLAALARQLPHTLRLRDGVAVERGSARLRIDSRLQGGRQTWDAEVKVSDIQARDHERSFTLQDPASVAARFVHQADRLTIEHLGMTTRYVALEASGVVSDLSGRRVADLRGTLSPDWEAINALVAEHIEPRARVSGQPRAFRLSGPLSGDWLKELDGEVGFDLKGAEFYGMRIGPAPIVLRTQGGRLAIEPIKTTINEGKLHLEPVLALDDKPGPTLRLGPESGITGAEINDEVSRRVLSFVAPVLNEATRVHGKVTVTLDDAVFPIGPGMESGAVVDGKITFQGVEFVAGPLADDLFALVGRERRPLIKLDEPVNLTIADRRVVSSGLALPIGDVARIELKGWVDFDQNLKLTASLPITSAMVGDGPLLSAVVAGTKVSVPIEGTLQHPKLDKSAFKLGMQDFGKTLLERAAGAGGAALLGRMLRPRDPDAPPLFPGLTPEARRARRQERQAERRMRREERNPPP